MRHVLPGVRQWRMNLRGYSVLGRCAVALAIVACNCGIAFPDAGKGAELKAVQALMTRKETQTTGLYHIVEGAGDQACWFPDNGSVTLINRGDIIIHHEFEYIWLGGVRRILQDPRTLHPELVSYWVKRTEDSNEFRLNEEKDKFVERALALVEGVPALSSWSDPLQSASKSLAEEINRERSVWLGGAPDSEKQVSYRSIDVRGKRQALGAVVERMLASAGNQGLTDNRAWNTISGFLMKDVEEQRTLAKKEYDKREDTSSSMRGIFLEVMVPPSSVSIYFETLEKMDRSIRASRIELREQALAPGKTPMEFLENNARKFIDLQDRFDRELVRFLDSPAARDNASWIRTADALYPVRMSLERREDLLKAGSWTQSLHLLANEIGLSLYLANLYKSGDSWDPRTGTIAYSPAVQQVAQNVDLINRYRERWVRNGKPPGPLYAATPVDNQGHPAWTRGGWLVWQWITSEDLEDLTVDGRVVEAIGRRWLLPLGTAPGSIRSLQDVHSVNARELIIAIDPAGAWKRIGEKSR